MEWLYTDLTNSNIERMTAMPSGCLMLIGNSIYSDSGDVITLIPVSAKDSEAKTVLSAYYASDGLKLEAVKFNRDSNQYKIKIDDYSAYDTVPGSADGEFIGFPKGSQAGNSFITDVSFGIGLPASKAKLEELLYDIFEGAYDGADDGFQLLHTHFPTVMAAQSVWSFTMQRRRSWTIHSISCNKADALIGD